MMLLKTRSLAAGACLCAGVLAGVTANRALVELPAWERLGVVTWAEFTRAENHGIGSVFYLVIGLLTILFTLATAIRLRRDPSLSHARRLPAYAAAVLALVYAVITRAILVPAVFRMRAAGNDSAALMEVFSQQARWWWVNDGLHVAAFALSLWAFAEILACAEGAAQ